jgi:hypothetical protein
MSTTSASAKADGTDDKPDSPKQLVLGFVFGIVFGFLLQKGGVAKYEVLMGALPRPAVNAKHLTVRAATADFTGTRVPRLTFRRPRRKTRQAGRLFKRQNQVDGHDPVTGRAPADRNRKPGQDAGKHKPGGRSVPRFVTFA